MKRRRPKSWFQRAIRWAPFLAGGLILPFTLGNCDPNVQDATLTGVQTTLVAMPAQLINMFILAFTHALANNATTQPVAQAAFENLHQWFA